MKQDLNIRIAVSEKYLRNFGKARVPADSVRYNALAGVVSKDILKINFCMRFLNVYCAYGKLHQGINTPVPPSYQDQRVLSNDCVPYCP